uniref:HTH CENPB-type domain-containing protein n=1 Tax=Equus asinus TaxID=9793 RepID=A0A9L0JZM6_EQUAS
MSSKRLHYDSALKRKVIVYAEMHGNRAAGRTFDISEANVRRWKNDRNSIFSCKATTKCFTGPKKGRYPQVDEAVLHFVSETRAKGLPITRQAMQLKAGEIAKMLGIDETKFKATRGWCDRFMRRAGLSLRRPTSFCPKLPADVKRKTAVEHSFQKCCVTSTLADTKGAVVWKSAHLGHCGLGSGPEESVSEFEVIVIT